MADVEILNKRIKDLEMLCTFYREFIQDYLNVHGIEAEMSDRANKTLKTQYIDELARIYEHRKFGVMLM